MSINAYPLQWPAGWPRTAKNDRKGGQFGKTVMKPGQSWKSKADITIADAARRVRDELVRLGISRGDFVISTNLTLNLGGDPRGDQREPEDPGVAVYWQPKGSMMTKVMAIDRYTKVRDNLAAIAATIEAMRAIERHGGAQILERAFTGFTALPAPASEPDPFEILGVRKGASRDDIEMAFRLKAKTAHPDRGGSTEAMQRLTAARDAALRA